MTGNAAAALWARTLAKIYAGDVSALDALELLTSTVPEQAAVLRERFWRDARFRLVCEDYREASEALDRLEKAHGPNDAPAVAHYRELLTDLLAEIVQMLGGKS